MVAFGLHVLLGAVLGLSVDEAHYLLYAAHPALSYFDHPPLVGWVQIPLVALQSPVVVLRLVPGLFWVLTVWGAYRLASRLERSHAGNESPEAASAGTATPGGAALATLIVLLLAPMLHVLSVSLLPDTLLMALTVGLLHQTLTLMQPDALQRTAPWLLLGALLGLAGLAKYTAIFTVPAIAVCLLGAHGWRVLRLPAFWAGMAVAAVFITPVLVWNAQNQWVSFTYQLAHGKGSAWQLGHLRDFLLHQLLVFGPLMLVAFWGWRQAPSGTRPLLWLFALPFAIFAYMSGGGTALPHWTAPSWVALAPFAGMGLMRLWHQATTVWGSLVRGLVTLLATLQFMVCFSLLALMCSAGWPLLPGSDAEVAPQPNPFADLHGWEAAGARARSLAAERGLGRLAVQNWTLASRLGWYAQPLAVMVLAPGTTQFSLWNGDQPKGDDALLVDWSHMAYEPPVGPHGFERCTLLESLPLQHWGQPLARFRFYDCRGWAGGAPTPQLSHSRGG
jgi:hypothetical protein